MLRIDFSTPPPKAILLDLDNTLWDFDGNAEEALAELFHRHHLHMRSNFNVTQFIELYKGINASYWRKYEAGEVNKEQLRTQRFYDTFVQMGISESDHPENIWDEYLAICPMMSRLMPGCLSFLNTIHKLLPVVIVTNGFQETQTVKLQQSGIGKFVSHMISSESIGVAKPEKAIFEKAVEWVAQKPNDCVYVGDTWHTDIVGGTNAGLNCIWYNHHQLDLPEMPLGSPLSYLGSAHSLLEIEAAFAEWFQMTN